MKPFLIFLFTTLAVLQADKFAERRNQMVDEQIKPRGVKDDAVLKAMRSVPRHEFVPEGSTWQAYRDSPLKIGFGQTISQPYIVAFMTEKIEPQEDFRVLEIGTGSGYQASVLAEIVDTVYTIEIIKKLGQQAIERLKKLEYNNVQVKLADGYYGWEEKGPFDAIVVTAAAEYIPPPLIEQLKEGGKMIIPVGTPFRTQQLVLVEKNNGKTKTKNLMFVRFVPFTRE